jgi:predicted DNA-binding transcriptional regulator YafY
MAARDYDKILTRLTSILTQLSNNERPTIASLAEEFNVSTKTIKRDIYERLIGFPIFVDSGHICFSDGYSLKDGKLSIEEITTLAISLSLVKGAGSEFEVSAKNLFSRLLAKNNKPSPYFIKAESYEYIDTDSAVVNTLEKAIEHSMEINLLTKDNIEHNLQPLKIINLDGIWYLLAKLSASNRFRSIFLSQIASIELTSVVFEQKNGIEHIISMMQSEYYEPENSFDVKVKIEKEVANYFRLKKHLPSQKTVSDEPNGALTVMFRAMHTEDVDNLIKSWLPHITIIEPAWFKEKLLAELRVYIENTTS